MQTQEQLQHKSQKAEAVRERPAIAPRVDVFENDQEILLLAELPGVSADGLRIDVDKDQLTLEGRRSDAVHGSALAAEYRHADFRRSFLVPDGIDRSKIDAELKGGLLRLRLPRADAVKARSIPIRSS
jgi:HSP20 family protein